MDLKPKHREWLAGRAIDPILAEKFGLRTTRIGDHYWLSVPFVENGKTVNHKHRVTSDKSKQLMDPDCPLTLCNHDCLLDQSLENQPLIVAEGEWDMLAVLTAGKSRVVSVPNGAPKRASDDTELAEGQRYAWFWRHQSTLATVRQVILAVDNDEAGKALAADLCRLFGAERCMFVDYPDGCKDPNDVLLLHGRDALLKMLDGARPYPVKGLYGIDDFPEQPSYTSYSSGVGELDGLIQVVPRTFTVITGYAGQGKTSFLMWVLAKLIRQNVHVTIASFETDIKPIFQRKLRAALLNKAEYSISPLEQSAWADELIRQNVAFISHNPLDDEEALSIDDVVELAKASVIRHGTRMLLIDPWNEVDHAMGKNESETDYTSRAIRKLKRFSKQYDVAVWVVAHPAKPLGGQTKTPGLYDISGSAHWANKPDYGLVIKVKSRDYWTTTISVTKVRMGLPGRIGKIVMQFDPNTSSYAYYGETEDA